MTGPECRGRSLTVVCFYRQKNPRRKTRFSQMRKKSSDGELNFDSRSGDSKFHFDFLSVLSVPLWFQLHRYVLKVAPRPQHFSVPAFFFELKKAAPLTTCSSRAHRPRPLSSFDSRPSTSPTTASSGDRTAPLGVFHLKISGVETAACPNITQTGTDEPAQ